MSNPKPSNLKPPGRCIFCGRTGLNKQHIWPNRLWKLIPRDDPEHSQFIIHVKRPNTEAVIIQPDLLNRQGAMHSRKLRIFCQTHCNGGWMRRLEERTFEFLPKLIRGEQETLTIAKQRTLAAWLMLVAIMAEFTDPSTLAIPASDRSYFMNNGEPPKTWNIWMGRYRGVEWNQIRYRHHGIALGLRSDIGRSMPCNTQITTQTIGELFIHIFSSTLPGLFTQRLDTFSPPMVPIWPTTSSQVEWPGSVGLLGDIEANMVADALFLTMLSSG